MSNEEQQDDKLDFGAGNAVPLPSRCLRVAKEPTDCDICIELCPVGALEARIPEPEGEEPEDTTAKSKAARSLEKKQGVKVGEGCINCGICAAACPTEALSNTKHHPKGLEKSLKDAADKIEGLAVGCARALFGVPIRYGSRAVTLPCLADLTPEAWFLAATLARDAVYEPAAQKGAGTDGFVPDVGCLKIFLPPLICDDCPVNCGGSAEAQYVDAIATAESWGADNIELVDTPEELAFTYSGKLLDELGDVTTDGKRELVEQLAAGFSKSWQSAGNNLEREKGKAEILAARRKKAKKTPQMDLNAPRPFGKKSTRRQLLRTALTMEESLAEGVELLCADTIASICTGCGDCVSACPLNARRRISSNSVLYFGKIPEEQRPKEEQAAVTDQLCCLGCSACVLACPTGACILTSLNGKDFYSLRQS